MEEYEGVKLIKEPLNKKQLKKYIENSVLISDGNLTNYVNNIS